VVSGELLPAALAPAERARLDDPVLRCPHCVRNPREWRGFVRGTAPGWGHPRRAPHRRWADVAPSGAYMVRDRHWLDHLYRLWLRDGRTVYVAEPYDLGRDDLADLEQLRGDGWCVSIDGRGAHNETTVRVMIERKPPAS
jgi:hypothetical protein